MICQVTRSREAGVCLSVCQSVQYLRSLLGHPALSTVSQDRGGFRRVWMHGTDCLEPVGVLLGLGEVALRCQIT